MFKLVKKEYNEETLTRVDQDMYKLLSCKGTSYITIKNSTITKH